MNVQIINLEDPAYDPLDDILDVTPIARTSIDDPLLPTPDQELFANDDASLLSSPEQETETEDEPKSTPETSDSILGID